MIHLKARCKLIVCGGRAVKILLPARYQKSLDRGNSAFLYICPRFEEATHGLLEEGCKGASPSGRHQKTRPIGWDMHRRPIDAKFVNALGSLLDPASLGKK